MSFILICFFCICPLFGFLLSLFLYFVSKNKYTFVSSLIIGISLGILSYFFIPLKTYDLVRHQSIVINFMGLSGKSMWTYFERIDLEFIPKVYSLLISYTNNVNLLQFFIVTSGYTILLYIMNDYRKKCNISTPFFIVVTMIIIFGFHVLYFFSGLYCYIAFIIFALAFYFDYEKGKSKYVCYFLYLFSLLIHNSIVFPLVILIAYKLLNNKINFKLILFGIIIYFGAFFILNLLNTYLDIKIVNQLYYMLYAYTARNYLFIQFYSRYVLLIELLKVIFIIICIYLLSKRKQYHSKTIGYIIYLTVFTLILMINSRIMIRYIILIQFISIASIMDYLSSNKRKPLIIYVMLFCMTIIFGGYFFHLLHDMNFGNLFSDKIFSPIFTIFSK